jgi:hypothetical protein
MFNRSTVFILGAGASVEYLYPTGEQLVPQVTQWARAVAHYCDRSAQSDDVNPYRPKCILRGEGRASATEIQQDWREAQKTFTRFASALAITNPPLIDHFLDSHDEFGVYGKMAVAATVLQAEVKHLATSAEILNAASPREKDWYRYVFDYLTRGCEDDNDLLGNDIHFITFNYDLSLEHELYGRLVLNRRFKAPNVKQFLRDHVLHIYGSLHEDYGYTKTPTDSSILQNDYRYEGSDWRHDCASLLDNIDAAAERICTIAPREKLRDQPTIARARQAIQNADAIYFVGYAFHELNNVVLDLEETLKPVPQTGQIKRLYVMNYKNSSAVAERIEKATKKATSFSSKGGKTYIAAESVFDANDTFGLRFNLF